jgi:hypothetical protein
MAECRLSPSPKSTGITPPRRQFGQHRLRCSVRARRSSASRPADGRYSAIATQQSSDRGVSARGETRTPAWRLEKGRMTASTSGRTTRKRGRPDGRDSAVRRLILEPFAIEVFKKTCSCRQHPRASGRCHVEIHFDGRGKIPSSGLDWQAFSIAGRSAIV